eukprot:CAMPEP_0176003774 /NCGR_PEP_ID=MMETSP0120_2-20121206/1348_1 /TAXON_ID=160619 /ORGANISM="Kryptoperidinium foliaceum, Strain CCMP 1326" /LENGTH=92 /DNA_ID=CAMNT_0017336429 /DNA_START=108 /DNA_END=386 /DNA_ORIENTATION=+
MMPLASRSLRSTATLAGRRQMSTTPKMHKASDKWADFVKQRPPKSHVEEHLCFHPPYNGPAVAAGIFTGVALGYGTMGYGMAHQQYKQGFWK